jgi:hypothetical protein
VWLLQAANFCSGLGNAMVTLAIPWLVMERLGSATLAGLVLGVTPRDLQRALSGRFCLAIARSRGADAVWPRWVLVAEVADVTEVDELGRELARRHEAERVTVDVTPGGSGLAGAALAGWRLPPRAGMDLAWTRSEDRVLLGSSLEAIGSSLPTRAGGPGHAGLHEGAEVVLGLRNPADASRLGVVARFNPEPGVALALEVGLDGTTPFPFASGVRKALAGEP